VIGEITRILWLGIPVRVPIHVYRRTGQLAGALLQKSSSLCVRKWSNNLVTAMAVEPVFSFPSFTHTSPVTPLVKSFIN